MCSVLAVCILLYALSNCRSYAGAYGADTCPPAAPARWTISQASGSGLLCRPSQVSASQRLSRPPCMASTSRAIQAFSLPPSGRWQGSPATARHRGQANDRAGSVGHSAAQRRHCTGPEARRRCTTRLEVRGRDCPMVLCPFQGSEHLPRPASRTRAQRRAGFGAGRSETSEAARQPSPLRPGLGCGRRVSRSCLSSAFTTLFCSPASRE